MINLLMAQKQDWVAEKLWNISNVQVLLTVEAQSSHLGSPMFLMTLLTGNVENPTSEL